MLKSGSLIGAAAGIDTKITYKLAADAPNTYPNGVSSMNVAGADDWPASGVVLTIAQGNYDYVAQVLLGNWTATAIYKRQATSGTTWTTWVTVIANSTGTVADTQIATNAVTTSKIADGAITTAKIADGAVGTADLANSAVTGAKIASSTITPNKLLVGDMTNLVSDGNFLDTARTNWAGSGTHEVVGGEPNRYKIITAASGNNDNSNSNIFQVVPSEKIWVTCEIYGETTNVGGGQPRIVIQFQRDDGTNTWVASALTRAGVQGAWTLLSGQITVPASARTGQVLLGVLYSADAVGNIYYFRRVAAYRATSTAQIVDGAVTTAKIADGAITATKIASGNLTLTGDLTATHVRITGVGDADLTTTDHGFQIGPDNGYNLAVDAGQSGGWCELQTRDGAGAAGAPLALNGRGGDVILGDSTSTVTAAGTVEMPDLPKGIIAAWTCTSNGAASAAERLQFTFPFTAVASRTYRVVVSGGLVDSESSVAQSAYCNLRWQQGASVTTASAACGRQIVATAASTNADLMSGVHVEGLITTASAGTVNCGFFIAAANGVNTIRYFATSIPTRVYVEDMGPSISVGSLTIT